MYIYIYIDIDIYIYNYICWLKLQFTVNGSTIYYTGVAVGSFLSERR